MMSISQVRMFDNQDDDDDCVHLHLPGLPDDPQLLRHHHRLRHGPNLRIQLGVRGRSGEIENRPEQNRTKYASITFLHLLNSVYLCLLSKGVNEILLAQYSQEPTALYLLTNILKTSHQ